MNFRILCSLLSLGQAAQAVLVPAIKGPFSATHTVLPLTDHSRQDPYAPNKTSRQILTSVFWPVDHSSCTNETIQYMPPATAASYSGLAQSAGLPNDTFSAFEIELCKLSKVVGCQARRPSSSRYPFVILSPGLAESRLLYSNMAKSLASHGHVVVTVDHPYEPDVVEFPNGSIVKGGKVGDSTAALEKAIQVRSADVSFILSQLRDPVTAALLIKGLPGKIDFGRVFAIGHSFGGAASAEIVRKDSRFTGGVDLDGQLFNPALKLGLDRPFMLLGRVNHTAEDATWNQVWKVLGDKKALVGINGTVHISYTDVPSLVQSLGLPEEVQPQVEGFIGTVEGTRLQVLLVKTLSSFFSFAKSGSSKALTTVSDDYPEVKIIRL